MTSAVLDLTGGYPVIAVLIDEDIDRAAQLRPGGAVRFRLARTHRIVRAPHAVPGP
jgi:allophanate hydrolase subunit 2